MPGLTKRLALTILCLFSGACSPTGKLTDSAAAKELTRYFERGWYEDVLLGDVKFYGQTARKLEQGLVPEDELPLYRAVAAAGWIVIANERDLTENFGSWSDFFALTQA